MRSLVVTFITLVQVSAFAPQMQPSIASCRAPNGSSTTQLDESLSRRDVASALISGISAVGLASSFPQTGMAFSQQMDDDWIEPSQQATDGRLDLNAAFVGDYKQLRGMYPTVAGKVASNGPYSKVSDVYKIDGLTDRDIKLLKQYEKFLTVNPPGRVFKERINARVST